MNRTIITLIILAILSALFYYFFIKDNTKEDESKVNPKAHDEDNTEAERNLFFDNALNIYLNAKLNIHDKKVINSIDNTLTKIANVYASIISSKNRDSLKSVEKMTYRSISHIEKLIDSYIEETEHKDPDKFIESMNSIYNHYNEIEIGNDFSNEAKFIKHRYDESY